MINDYILALLSAPPANPMEFADGQPALWMDNLRKWLDRAAELDHSFRFDEPVPDQDNRRLRLRTRLPLASTTDFVIHTSAGFDRPGPSWAGPADCDLVVHFLCMTDRPAAPQSPPREDPCTPWAGREGLLVVEPRWAAAVLMAHEAPLFWGASAREESKSLLDSPRSGAGGAGGA
ncbi:hypothetical protein AB0G60_34355 [Streptomyces angustmyceticus]|uniref:Uncharacterized protein n=1 Tax=Streptomyces angustmyceticus TaxID=285578 RepID=A0A5J4LPN8_9ACTN|nr:hypothetical protein [Streptomyces angustmyceticus]UAL70910.1 hypothetical protein K7396_33775 [Streptomyces angustmyceticus]GES33962.1 hypothetical protein San01_64500 [Streptomyces angustmyceticus]